MMRLYRELQNKRKIRKLFRTYGKTVYQARVEYVNGFFMSARAEDVSISVKPRLKLVLVTVLILIVLMTVAIAGAKTFDIPLPTFSFIEQSDHTDVTVNLEDDSNQTKDFLEIGYVPEGYSHVGTDSFADASCGIVYVNDAEEYLYINQYRSKETVMDIDNENCERYVESISGMDVEIFDYEDGRKTYLFVKKQICIVVQGCLSEMEMQSVVENLN